MRNGTRSGGSLWLLFLLLAAAPACSLSRRDHACLKTRQVTLSRSRGSPPPEATDGTRAARKKPVATEKSALDRIWATLSQEDDPDGPINTDRPTFTPANTTVPRGRLQFESGFTFNNQPASGARTTLYDLPELAMRYGITKRVEFRTFWQGQTWIQTQSRPGGPWRLGGGLSDMEVGFKWQLLTLDKEKKWIPSTALITSIYAPTGGTSVLGSHTVEPYINLIYGWGVTDKLTLGGSTGYLGMRLPTWARGDRPTALSAFTNPSSGSIP